MNTEQILVKVYDKLMSATSNNISIFGGEHTGCKVSADVCLFGRYVGRVHDSDDGDACFVMDKELFDKMSCLGTDRLSSVVEHIGVLAISSPELPKANKIRLRSVAESLSAYFWIDTNAC